MPSPSRQRKPLRRVLWIFLVLLFLPVAGWIGFRYSLDGMGRAVLKEAAARQAQPKPPAPPPQERPAGPPVFSLPVFAGIASSDPAVRDAHAALTRDLLSFRTPLHEDDEQLDFVLLLRLLNVTESGQLKQREAAAAFLNHAARFRPFLDSLHEALEAGQWDFGPPPLFTDAAALGRMDKLGAMLVSSASLLAALAQAHEACANSDHAIATWLDLARLVQQTGFPQDLLTAATGLGVLKTALLTAGAGLANNGWRDADLAAISRSLEALDPLNSYRLGLRGDNERIIAFIKSLIATPDEAFADASPQQPPSSPFQAFLKRSIKPDPRILLDANTALVSHRFEILEGVFDYRTRVYLQPSQNDAAFLASLWPGTHLSTFEKSYFYLARIAAAGSLHQETMITQVFLDQTRIALALELQKRIALALELQKRTAGSYPESLNPLAPAFPGGLPHDISTGRPYLYQKTPEGSYRLWGTGIDQKDNGGDPDQDVLFKLPKSK